MAAFIAFAVLTVSILWFAREAKRILQKVVLGLAELNARERESYTAALLREVHQREILERLLVEVVGLRDDIRRANAQELAARIHVAAIAPSANGPVNGAQSRRAAG